MVLLELGSSAVTETQIAIPKCFLGIANKRMEHNQEIPGRKQDIWSFRPCGSLHKGCNAKNRIHKHSCRDSIWKQHVDWWHSCPQSTSVEEATESGHTSTQPSSKTNATSLAFNTHGYKLGEWSPGAKITEEWPVYVLALGTMNHGVYFPTLPQGFT